MADCRKHVSPDEQARTCSEVIDQKPGIDILARAWSHRGEAYARKGMANEAILNFTRAIETKSDLVSAWSGRGTAHLVTQKFDDAIKDFTTVISLDPGNVQAYVSRGYAHLVKDKPKRAIDDFSRALQLDPQYLSAYNNRGLALVKLGQPQRAISDYTRAIQINPLYALAYNNRGYAYEATGKKSKAVNDFRNALSIDPSLTGARDGLLRLSAAGNIAAQNSSRVASGREIARKSCAWCHAVGPKGDSPNKDAPSFRSIHERHPILSLRAPISRAIATPHDKMPKLPLSEQEVDQIIAYINSLRS
jgi:tetratricopeptide (TPR) repeat protein